MSYQSRLRFIECTASMLAINVRAALRVLHGGFQIEDGKLAPIQEYSIVEHPNDIGDQLASIADKE